MKVVGFIPARMGATRFPGKPLYPLLGRPMIEHVFLRASMFRGWSGLYLTTCDAEIETLCHLKDWPVLMTSNKHTRALDRVAEAALKCEQNLNEEDIVICVQGDEPLLTPTMIELTLRPIYEDLTVHCTVLAMHIVHEEQWRNPDTVKIVCDKKGNVLYNSRSPIPYAKTFSSDLNARRIVGIFAFRYPFLKKFTSLAETPLEMAESCDSNRILDHGLSQRIAPCPYSALFSVDSPEDVVRVEKALQSDPLWGTY